MEPIMKIAEICISMNQEQDLKELEKQILDTAMEIAGCDAGTLYIVENNALTFRVIRNNSMHEYNGNPSRLKPVPLREEYLCSASVVRNQIINIDDAYHCTDFALSHEYDESTGYHTQSVLVCPLITGDGRQIGALQLINALDENHQVCAFSAEVQNYVYALASVLSVGLQKFIYADAVRHMRETLKPEYMEMIPAEIRNELSAYFAANYYGHMLDDRQFSAVIRDVASSETDEKKRGEIYSKQQRRQKDLETAAEISSVRTAGSGISAIREYVEKRMEPKALEVLRRYVYDSGLSSSEIANRACIIRGTFSGMISGNRVITKYNLIAICFALSLTFEQASELLYLNGDVLTGAEKKDVVLDFFLHKSGPGSSQNVVVINSVLDELGVDPIGTVTK